MNSQFSQQGPIAPGQQPQQQPAAQLPTPTPNTTTAQGYQQQQQPSSINGVPTPQLNPSTVMNSSLYQQPQPQAQQIKPQTIPYMSTNPSQATAMGATTVAQSMPQPVGMVGGPININPGATGQTGVAVSTGQAQPTQMGMYQAQPQNMNSQMLPGKRLLFKQKPL